jgi:hypothetical protein
MYKTLGISLVLLAVFAFTSGSRSADASPSTAVSAPIVAKGKLVNQSTIPTTTIFTPIQSGFYRLSVYMTITSPVTNASQWSYNLNWSDDAGAEQAQAPLFAFGYQTPGVYPGAYGTTPVISIGNPGPGAVLTFQAVAGSPVTYSVSGGIPADGSLFSLYYVVERLE